MSIACDPKCERARTFGTIRSPSWHRRLRAKRSQLRRRVHSARAAGLSPPLRALRILAAHHTAPRFKELMGGRGKAKWGNWPRPTHGTQDGWEWRSSGSAWNPKGAGKWDYQPLNRRQRGDQEDDNNQFPGFEMMKPRAKPALANKEHEPTEGDLEDMPVGSYMKGVQKILNNFRKAEGRTRKIENLKEELDAKWEAFQQSLKDSYMKERKKYQDKVGRLASDMEEVQQAKEEAIQELKEALKSPSSLVKTKEPTEDATALEDLAKLLATPSQGQNEALSDILAAAFNAGEARDAGGRTRLLEVLESHRRPAPTTPPSRRPTYVERTPTAAKSSKDKEKGEDAEIKTMAAEAMEVEPDASRDPYMTSPTGNGLNGILPSPGRGLSRSRPRAGRTPVKHVHRKPTALPPSRACTKRLEAKRQEAMLEHVEESDEEDLIGDLNRDGAGVPHVEIE